jgi:hypothetical protein
MKSITTIIALTIITLFSSMAETKQKTRTISMTSYRAEIYQNCVQQTKTRALASYKINHALANECTAIAMDKFRYDKYMDTLTATTIALNELTEQMTKNAKEGY